MMAIVETIIMPNLKEAVVVVLAMTKIIEAAGRGNIRGYADHNDDVLDVHLTT